jgi:hypothetical protein
LFLPRLSAAPNPPAYEGSDSVIGGDNHREAKSTERHRSSGLTVWVLKSNKEQDADDDKEWDV